MRWFSAHREAANSISAPRARRRLFKSALFAIACLAGVGLSSGERFEARAADDGGMMSFLLGGNGGGRARAAAPQFRFDPPALGRQAPAARKTALSRHKAKAVRTTRYATVHRHATRSAHAAAAAGVNGAVQKASYQTTLNVAEQNAIARTLVLKAAAAAARPDDAHLNDKTLRRGDIVATAGGLRVFLGSERFPYRSRDFAPISAARHVAQRPVLEALDRSLRGIRLVARSQIQKRVAKVAAVPKAQGAEAVRRVDARPAPAAQAIALAYAPRTGSSGVEAAGPAIQAIERAVRRVDGPAATRAAPERPRFVATQGGTPAKRAE